MMKNKSFTTETQRHGDFLKNSASRAVNKFLFFSLCLCVSVVCFSINVAAQQEAPPAPGAPKPVSIPAVKEKTLRNGLTVVVAEKRTLPLVTIQFQIPTGGSGDDSGKAGTANLTATLLTKGTKTRTATQIVESIESLGGSINSGASFNASTVTVTATSDKVNQVMAILADVVLNPAFAQREIDLLKKQTIDDLSYRMTQPGSLAGFVTSRYTFDEYPVIGTLQSIPAIDRKTIQDYYNEYYLLQNATLIFTGDIAAAQANALAQRFFGRGGTPVAMITSAALPPPVKAPAKTGENEIVRRMLVIDMPNSGQAAVTFAKQFKAEKTAWSEKDNSHKYTKIYFPAIVLNSLLGGGYSSRLNQEIRIKRGLSYGAGSSFAWRYTDSNFSARTQTKDNSAAEVAELMIVEIKRLIADLAPEPELDPRRQVLVGNFGRDLETTAGLTNALSDLYLSSLRPTELNSFMTSVRSVTPAEIRAFAAEHLKGGDIIIVGDYALFKEDLAKRFPNMKIEVIKVDELDLSSENLRKSAGTVKADA